MSFGSRFDRKVYNDLEYDSIQSISPESLKVIPTTRNILGLDPYKKGSIIYDEVAQVFYISSGVEWMEVSGIGLDIIKGSLISADGTGTPVELPVGTNGQVLSADPTESTGLKWIDNTSGLVISKGSLISADISNTSTELPTGTNGQILSVDTAETTGLKWIDNTTTGSNGTVTTVGAATETIDTFSIANGETVLVTSKLIGRETTNNSCAGYKSSSLIKNVAGTLTKFGPNDELLFFDTGYDATTVNFTISGTDINIEVTGLVGETILWNSRTDIYRV